MTLLQVFILRMETVATILMLYRTVLMEFSTKKSYAFYFDLLLNKLHVELHSRHHAQPHPHTACRRPTCYVLSIFLDEGIPFFIY